MWCAGLLRLRRGTEIGQVLPEARRRAVSPGMDRYTLDGFLKGREVWLEYTMDDLRREVELGERLWKKRQEELGASGQ